MGVDRKREREIDADNTDNSTSHHFQWSFAFVSSWNHAWNKQLLDENLWKKHVHVFKIFLCDYNLKYFCNQINKWYDFSTSLEKKIEELIEWYRKTLTVEELGFRMLTLQTNIKYQE